MKTINSKAVPLQIPCVHGSISVSQHSNNKKGRADEEDKVGEECSERLTEYRIADKPEPGRLDHPENGGALPLLGLGRGWRLSRLVLLMAVQVHGVHGAHGSVAGVQRVVGVDHEVAERHEATDDAKKDQDGCVPLIMLKDGLEHRRKKDAAQGRPECNAPGCNALACPEPLADDTERYGCAYGCVKVSKSLSLRYLKVR